jgi:hypothetical protein
MVSNAASETVENPWRFLQSLRGDSVTDLELARRTRKDELRVVADMVASSRVSILYAYSGNGKTSLINAGLVPFFDSEGYAIYRTRPRPPWCPSNPTMAFKQSILRDLPEPTVNQTDLKLVRQARQKLKQQQVAGVTDLDQILSELEARLTKVKDPDTAARKAAAVSELRNELEAHLAEPLRDFLSRLHQSIDSNRRMVFVCDQFEELFVHYADTPELDEFINALGTICACDELPLHILFSMREEWVGSMIAFRRAIPDIFSSSFKLNPLRVSVCKPILQLPAKARGLVFVNDCADQVLQDLAEHYSLNARMLSCEVRLAPSPARDPFVELPALQVVVDQLWQTRESHAQPFSLAHYQWLGEQVSESELADEAEEPEENNLAAPPARATAAKKILDSYLLEILERIEDPDPAMAPVWKDLRLDCLYLLTDRTRHRRALVEPHLIEELNLVRPRELGLQRADSKLLETALQPLVKLRLVHVETAANGLSQYELAHDFLVRSVVSAWRHLDRRRTGDLAVLNRTREKQEIALHNLEATQRRALRNFVAAPIVAGLALFLEMLWVVSALPQFFDLGLTPLGWVMVSAASLMTATSIIRRVRLHVVSSVLLLAFTLVLLTLAHMVRIDFWRGVTGFDRAGAYILYADIPLVLWFLFAFPLNIIDVNRRVGGSLRTRRILSIMWAELVDFTIMAGTFGLGLPALAVRLYSSGTTPGLRWAGFTGVVTRSGDRPGFLRALLRQLLMLLLGAPIVLAFTGFLVAANGLYDGDAHVQFLVACGMWLPWLIVSPLVIAATQRHQNLYDLICGTAPVGLGFGPAEPKPAVKTEIAASARFSGETQSTTSAPA